MKRMFILLAAFAAIAAIVTGSALAGTGPNYGKSAAPGIGGNGTQVTHFKASYHDWLAGDVNCSGIRQDKKGAVSQESETCTSATGSPVGYWTPGSVNPFGPGFWVSDNPNTLGAPSSGGTITVSADGMSYNIIANY